MKGFRLWLSMLCVLVLAACGQGSVKSPDFSSELIGINVTASDPDLSVGLGETIQFSASGVISSQPGQPPSLIDLNGQVEWTSSNPAVATINSATGLATGGSATGTTIITATKGKIKGSIELTSEGLVLRELIVTPNPVVLGPGQSKPVRIQGRYSDSATPRDLDGNPNIDWIIADSALATAIPATGNPVSIKAGTTQGETELTAKIRGRTQLPNEATVRLIVGRIESLRIEPNPGTSPVGIPLEFTAIASFETPASGTILPDAEVAVTWSTVPNPAVPVTLDSACSSGTSSKCIITGRAVGSVTVNAIPDPSLGAPSTTGVFNITAAILTKVAIESVDPNLAILPGTPVNPVPRVNVGIGSAPRFQARYFYSDDLSDITPRDNANLVTWTISDTVLGTLAVDPDTNIATVTTRAQTPPNGPLLLNATVSPTIKDSLRINIGAATVQSIDSIRPVKAYVAQSFEREFVAVGKFTDGSTADLPDSAVTWSSDNVAVALQIGTNTGRFRAVGPIGQAALITARLASNTALFKTADFVITDSRCALPLRSADGAQAIQGPSAGIGLVTVANAANVVDADATITTPASISVVLGALNAYGGIDVSASANPSGAFPFPAGYKPGFIISQPNGVIARANILNQIEVSTLSSTGAEIENSALLQLLQIDLLGTTVIGGQTVQQVLVAFPSSIPFNGVRLRLKGGTAAALATTRVFAACADTNPSIPVLDGIGSVYVEQGEVFNHTVETGYQFNLGAKNLSGEVIPEDDGGTFITWTSSNPAVATINPTTGAVNALTPGTTTFTVTLTDQLNCTGACTGTFTLTVVQGYCTATGELTGTVVVPPPSLLCLLCSVSNKDNVADGNPNTYADLNIPVGVLASLSFHVNVPTQTPVTPKFVGFKVKQADQNSALFLSLLDQIRVRTYLNNTLQDDSSNVLTSPLNVDLLGLDVDNYPYGAVSLRTSKPYDRVELQFSTLLAALSLGEIRATSPCNDIQRP